jgi:formylglycine-generating enzyme
VRGGAAWIGCGVGLGLVGACFAAVLADEAESVVEPVTGMVFVAIPAGCFEMGDLDVGIVGRVCLDDFLMSRTEVTNGQFRELVPGHSSGGYAGHDLNSDEQPVVNVSFAAAAAYAEALAARTGWSIRLPTEAEWEYAARAGSTAARFWGPDLEPAYRYANFRDRPGDYRVFDPYPVTAPVASFRPNAFGLYDMLGNASEWVLDGWAAGAGRYGEVQVRENPVVEDETPLRVRRGGSFDDPVSLVRTSSRDFFARDFRLPQTGFRLVLVPDAAGPVAAVQNEED